MRAGLMCLDYRTEGQARRGMKGGMKTRNAQLELLRLEADRVVLILSEKEAYSLSFCAL